MSVFIGFPPLWVQLGESEQRASTLQLSVERLSAVLAAEAESGSKDRAQGSPLTAGSSAPQRLQQLQSALTAGELDRRMLQVGTGTPGVRGDPLGSVSPCVSPRQEMLDAARRALSEAREEKSALREQLRVLRGERAALELRKEELEAQVRRLQEVGAPRLLALPPGCALCPSARPVQQPTAPAQYPIAPMQLLLPLSSPLPLRQHPAPCCLHHFPPALQHPSSLCSP